MNPDVQNAIRSGGISAGHGRAIISLDDENLQQVLFKKIITEGLNVRQAEKVASELKNPEKKSEKPADKSLKELPNHLRKVQKSLADVLDVGVEIKSSGKGKKGKIILDFNNEEELSKILSHFN